MIAMQDDMSPALLDACSRNGRAWVEAQVSRDANAYDRARDLKRIIPGYETEAVTVAGAQKVIKRLLKEARTCARLSRLGHWSYDFNRHVAVLGALRAERKKRAELRRTEQSPTGEAA